MGGGGGTSVPNFARAMFLPLLLGALSYLGEGGGVKTSLPNFTRVMFLRCREL